MSDKIGLFTGSFDPVTNGHVDLFRRASHLVDHLYVGIFFNQEKPGFFSVDRRQFLIEQAVAGLPNISVISSHDKLAVEVAKDIGAGILIRGLRNTQDLNYETSLDYFNHDLAPQLETIYLLSSPEYSQISSSRIRELVHFGADVRPYVPEAVALELEKIQNDD
ncbi:pantetheine-phosphate adenylyltransferase [Streptococcus dentasini]